MGKKSNDSPDYAGLAREQGIANEAVTTAQTYANRPTQYTPWGSTSWSNNSVIDPSTGKPVTSWTQTQSLTPELQAILDKEIAIQGGRSDVANNLTSRMKTEFASPMDWSNLSPMGEAVGERDIGDPNAWRQRSTDAMYSQAMNRLDPAFADKRAAMEIKLRNQGLNPEDAAYQAQFKGLGEQETDARNNALWSSIGAGRDESNAMFNQQAQRSSQGFSQAMQGSQYANQIRQQQIAEAMQKRGFSLNEINALMSGQQVQTPNMPNFTPATAAQAAPIYQAGVDQGNYNSASNPMSGLLGLAGTIGGGYAGSAAGGAAITKVLGG
jgi:hypothetical protein